MAKQKSSKKLSAREIQMILGPKVTQTALDHELFRFNNMDRDALVKRLTKIKKPVKAEAMRMMAKIIGDRTMAKKARIRRDELFTDNA